MNENESPWQTILETKDRQECVDSSFMLEAMGIPVQSHFDKGVWRLTVPASEVSSARSELTAFQAENRASSDRPLKRVSTYGGASLAVAIYAVVVLSVAFLKRVGSFGIDWLEIGRMHAGSVVSGQWSRSVTALTLHMDTSHILSNLGFGALFGLFAGRVFGGGVAWLLIVIAGSVGNGINAMIHDPAHSSVGASTAVFASLGILVAHALSFREKSGEKLMRQWSPLIAGSVLLALTGVGGPRTDVMAHVNGFVAGGLLGSMGCYLPKSLLGNKAAQIVAGSLALGMIVIAWWIRLAMS